LSGTGVSGEDARADATQAAGGASVDCGTDGGAGAAGSTMDGADVSGLDNCGGGGGGGGAGYILIRTPDFDSTGTVVASPPALVNP
jgi:hypothetical protein